MAVKHRQVPEGAERLTTYAQLIAVIQAFAQGHLHAVLVVGDGGLGKTEAVREALDGRGHEIKGRASGFQLYREALEHRDEPLVLDDIDHVTRDSAKLALLKCLLETTALKTLTWHTAVARREGLPTRFETRSRVILLANRWTTADADVVAVEDRVHVYEFVPDNLEVHTRAATFFWDQTVYDYIGERLGLFPRLTLRHYVLAWEKKLAGLGQGVGWRDYLLSRGLKGNALLVAQLRFDASFATEADRVAAFLERTGLRSKQSYYDVLRTLPPSTQSPPILLTARPPTPIPGNIEGAGLDITDFLRRRHRRLGEG